MSRGNLYRPVKSTSEHLEDIGIGLFVEVVGIIFAIPGRCTMARLPRSHAAVEAHSKGLAIRSINQRPETSQVSSLARDVWCLILPAIYHYYSSITYFIHQPTQHLFILFSVSILSMISCQNIFLSNLFMLWICVVQLWSVEFCFSGPPAVRWWWSRSTLLGCRCLRYTTWGPMPGSEGNVHSHSLQTHSISW